MSSNTPGQPPYGNGPQHPGQGWPQQGPQGQPPYGPPPGQPQGQPGYAGPPPGQGQPPYGGPQQGQPYGGPQQPGQGWPPQGPPQGPQTEVQPIGGGYGPGGPGGYGPGGPGGPGQPPYGEPKKKRSAGAKAAIIGASLALIIGLGAGGVWAYNALIKSSGPQASEALPADALFYFGIDLDPSAEQKVNAIRFLNHFPAFKEEAGVEDANADVRKVIFEKALEESDCTGVTYADDVEPWLGDKFGVAGMPSEDEGSDPEVAVAMEVSDQGQAEDGLAALNKCGDSEEYGSAFVGDYMIIAETQKLADKYAGAAEEQPLSDSDKFAEDMESLGDLGVATLWVDIEGAIDLFPEELSAESNPEVLKQYFQRAAATFRFEPDSVEVVTSIRGDIPEIDHPDNQVVDLPETTAFAMSEAGGGERLDVSWDTIVDMAKSEGVDIDAELAEFESQTGLSIPEDLSTMLGENLMIAADSEGLTADALQSQDPSQFNVGVRFTNNPEDLNAIYEKLLGVVEAQLGGQMPFAKKDFDDGIVIASNDGYADTLGGLGGGLGDSQAFSSVVDDAAEKELVMFFNWDSIEEEALEALTNLGAPAEVIENLKPLQSVGYSQDVEGEYMVGSFQVSVND